MNAFVGFILFYCWSSFHGAVAVVMEAHHGVWGFEKSDKISENPVFSRLPTFAPIITEESILRTMPVAFISVLPPECPKFTLLLFANTGELCEFLHRKKFAALHK